MLETERLQLRPFTLEDAPFILRLLNEPSFIQHIADKGVRTLEQAEAYLQGGPMASQALNGHGLWAVLRKSDGALLGMCGLIKRPAFTEIDLGYAFLPEFWGRGYAREAARGCLDWGHDAMGLRQVIAFVSPRNEASVRLLITLGFHFVRMIQMEPKDPGTALYKLPSIA